MAGAFRRRGTDVGGLVGDADASCLQGGELFIAGLVAEGVVLQVDGIAFPQARVSDQGGQVFNLVVPKP